MLTAATAGSAILPCFTAMSSATMLTAISCGVIGADVESDRRVDRCSASGVTPSSRSASKMRFTLALLPISPTIPQIGRHERPQRVEVVRVAARDDHGVRRRRQLVRCSHVGMSSTMTSMPSAKRSAFANFSRSSTTWTRKPASCAIRADVVADVPGAEDVDVRRWLDRLDEDLHLTAADEPGFLREVVVELVLHVERPARP